VTAEIRLSNTSNSIWNQRGLQGCAMFFQTDLLLSVSGLSTHVRKQGDVVELEQSRVDIRLIREDIDTRGEEL
jgi:hypothetical protein